MKCALGKSHSILARLEAVRPASLGLFFRKIGGWKDKMQTPNRRVRGLCPSLFPPPENGLECLLTRSAPSGWTNYLVLG